MILNFCVNHFFAVGESKKINIGLVKPVYEEHSREPENVPFMSRCPLYIG